MTPSRTSQIAKGCPVSTMWTMAPLDHEQLHGDPAGQRPKFGRRSLRQFVASSQAAFTVVANCEYWELSQLWTTRPRITGPPGLRGYPRAMLANRATNKAKKKPPPAATGSGFDRCLPSRGHSPYARLLYLFWAGFDKCTQRRFFHGKKDKHGPMD